MISCLGIEMDKKKAKLPKEYIREQKNREKWAKEMEKAKSKWSPKRKAYNEYHIARGQMGTTGGPTKKEVSRLKKIFDETPE